MHLTILPTAESHFEELRRVQDIVAREKCYLAFLQAPPREQAFDFFRNIVTNGFGVLAVMRARSCSKRDTGGARSMRPLPDDARTYTDTTIAS